MRARSTRLWWRLKFQVSGGLTVVGSLPAGGCVVVHNGASTLDGPALLVALGRGQGPVHRDGGGGPDPNRRLVVHGRDVDHACRLAAGRGLPVVPVGIVGLDRLIRPDGGLRPRPVAVRVGQPMGPDRAAVAAAVDALASQPAPRADSAIRRRLAAFARSPAGTALVAVWAAAEASAWPLLPEFLLAALAVAAPRRAVRLALVAAAASLAGGTLTYLLAAHGVVAPQPLTTARMHATAVAQLAAEGSPAVAHQPMSGIPYKVYAAAAGRAGTGLGGFLVASLKARGLRIVAVGALCGVFGALASRWRRWYGAYLVAFVMLFAAGLAAVLRSWR
jgi:1-acyl-sn-glycerol-3-phosphate acyltransferase